MEKKQVRVVEIGPRDGFQNVAEFIPTKVKQAVITGLVEAGFRKIQATSFVSPKAIPQLRDAKEVVEYAIHTHPEVEFFALVPNLYGAKAAKEAGLKEIALVMSLSESHNMANVKRTHQQSLEELRRIRQELPDLEIIQDIATVFGCPFEGEMPIQALLSLIEKVEKEGIHSINLCDTIGIAYPSLVEEVFQTVTREFPKIQFHAHIHDTRNMGMLNTFVAIMNGAYSVQTTIGGLGGCPFAPGASGNTATEDLIYMLSQSGFETGIDFDKLLKTAKYVKSQVDGNYSGHQIMVPEKPCIITQE